MPVSTDNPVNRCRTTSIPSEQFQRSSGDRPVEENQHHWSPQILLPHGRGLQPSPTTGLSGLSSFGRDYHDCVKFATAPHPGSWSPTPSTEQGRTKRPTCANGDGYSWRKYGEKYVKGSPFPRSYYKCSHLGCTVKKIIERDADSGHLYQTTSQGNHCHPRPGSQDPAKSEKRHRSSTSSQQSLEDDWAPCPMEDDDANDTVFSLDREPSSASGSPDCESDLWDQARAQAVNWREAQREAKRRRLEQDAVARLTAMKEEREGLSTGPLDPEHDEDLDGNGDGHAEEGPIHSRPSFTSAASSKQTFEVPLSGGSVNDGYRWRKYGQKMVKGNIHPRSYYKCTYSGCGVRKHVERSGLHPDRLLITYEGEHMHDVPDVGSARSKKPARAAP
ncbi:hypothetical protein WJX84_010023, partial [Apatococcus fuscideae]